MISAYSQVAIDFVKSIGIPVMITPGATGVLPHIRIVAGGLHIDPACTADDILHESGHLSCTPRRWRHLCDHDISNAHAQMFADLHASDEYPDSPLFRAALQAGEQEAISWAWAAGEHLGLPPEVIISDRPEAFDGHALDIRTAHLARCAPGIHGLAHAGFTSTNGLNGKLRYPLLAFWTQEL